MGVRITSDGEVALFDSTTGKAFGPIFGSESSADSFLEWNDEKEENGEAFTTDEGELVAYQDDVRKYTPTQLIQVYDLWREYMVEEGYIDG